MFNRTAPAALLIAFVAFLVAAAALVLVTGALGTATPGQDGVPAAYTYQTGPGHTFNSAPTIDTAAFGTDIPRCASDDWNSTGLPRCYTESPDSVIIIDQSDNTIGVISK